MEGLHQVGTVREKSMIKVHKMTQVALRLGLWDSLNFLR